MEEERQGIVHHVSAAECKLSCPGTLCVAMSSSHPAKSIWFDSYHEEYDGLQGHTFDISSADEYRHIEANTGKATDRMMISVNNKVEQMVGHRIRKGNL